MPPYEIFYSMHIYGKKNRLSTKRELVVSYDLKVNRFKGIYELKVNTPLRFWFLKVWTSTSCFSCQNLNSDTVWFKG